METSVKGATTVYRHEYNGKALYSVTMTKKNLDGTREYGYVDAKFRRGVEVRNHERIEIKSGWLTFYRKGKETVVQVFINDFEEAEKAPLIAPEPFESIEEDIPF